jgi:ubiquinone/menaquinone biosynthesis C-methylase UbiE
MLESKIGSEMANVENTAKTHVYREDVLIPCEDTMLAARLTPGMNVLDVGCAATGRSARLIRDFDCNVWSIDVNLNAIKEFQNDPRSRGIHLAAADACHLPFESGVFDLVMVALNGLDYVLPKTERCKALRELQRVLKPNRGCLIFNTLNPVGVITSPRGLTSWFYLKWRLRQIASLGFLKETLIDSHGLEMYQSLPGRVIQQVEDVTDMKCTELRNQKGTTTNKFLLTLFSAGPYFAFERRQP